MFQLQPQTLAAGGAATCNSPAVSCWLLPGWSSQLCLHDWAASQGHRDLSLLHPHTAACRVAAKELGAAPCPPPTRWGCCAGASLSVCSSSLAQSLGVSSPARACLPALPAWLQPVSGEGAVAGLVRAVAGISPAVLVINRRCGREDRVWACRVLLAARKPWEFGFFRVLGKALLLDGACFLFSCL